MAGRGFESMSSEEKLRMTIHKDVRAICQETAHCVGMDMQTHAMELVAELVYKKLRIFGCDLELFAKHAKRSTINSEDVKLLVRRNPSLKTRITNIADANVLASGSKEGKKKRTMIVPSTSGLPSTSNVTTEVITNSTDFTPLPGSSRVLPQNITNVAKLNTSGAVKRKWESDVITNHHDDREILDDFTIDLT